MKYFEERTTKHSAYPHKLSSGLVKALIAVAREYRRTGEIVKTNQLESLTHNQRANFQKLKHWDLIVSPKKGSGYYVSEKGMKFLRGEISVPDMMASLENKTLPLDHPCWDTHGTKPTPRKVYEILNLTDYTYYKDYEEFAADKVSERQSRMF